MFYIKSNDRKKELGLFEAFNNMFSRDMKTNIEENEDKYIVSVELAGVDKSSVNINVENSTLVIEVNHNQEAEDKKYLLKERSSYTSTRSFYLEDMDEDSIVAKMDNGILTIDIKKINNPLTKRIINID